MSAERWSETDPVIATRRTTIGPGDHVGVSCADGTWRIRWLLPGTYEAGDEIAEDPTPRPGSTNR
jgi:hypothetical protein